MNNRIVLFFSTLLMACAGSTFGQKLTLDYMELSIPSADSTSGFINYHMLDKRRNSSTEIGNLKLTEHSSLDSLNSLLEKLKAGKDGISEKTHVHILLSDVTMKYMMAIINRIDPYFQRWVWDLRSNDIIVYRN